MLLTRLRPLMSLLAGASLLGGAVLATAQPAATSSGRPLVDAAVRPVFAASCIGYCKHPTNAGKVFRWDGEALRWQFHADCRPRPPSTFRPQGTPPDCSPAP